MTMSPKDIRAAILRISHASGHGHIPTCFSVVEMLAAVYDLMRHDPARPDWEERDIFLLSKGHASLAHYCTLAGRGYFPLAEVEAFGRAGSRFGCHADRHKVPGIEASTGSLGHGIGIATGMALAARIAKSPRRVFVLIGDGESNEGSVWEAAMVAANLELDNLTVIFDHNGSQARCLPIPNPAERFAAFGFDTVVVDGHDVAALKAALDRGGDRPRAVIANAVKGWGCKTLVDEMYAWHRRSPNAEELARLLEDLDAWTV